MSQSLQTEIRSDVPNYLTTHTLEGFGLSLEFDWIDMSRRLFAASGGRVGMVIELLEVAVRSATRTDVLAFSDTHVLQDHGGARAWTAGDVAKFSG